MCRNKTYFSSTVNWYKVTGTINFVRQVPCMLLVMMITDELNHANKHIMVSWLKMVLIMFNAGGKCIIISPKITSLRWTYKLETWCLRAHNGLVKSALPELRHGKQININWPRMQSWILESKIIACVHRNLAIAWSAFY